MCCNAVNYRRHVSVIARVYRRPAGEGGKGFAVYVSPSATYREKKNKIQTRYIVDNDENLDNVTLCARERLPRNREITFEKHDFR